MDTKTTETARDQPATAEIKPGDLVSIVADGETVSRDHKVVRVLKINKNVSIVAITGVEGATRMTLVLAEKLRKQ